jgi:hypothetical protein
MNSFGASYLFRHGLKVQYAGVARTDDGLQIQHHNLVTQLRVKSKNYEI